jgi:tetratricopeptide (TPR) repeat protein
LPTSALAAILACGIALSPAYGEHATKTFAIRGWRLRAAVLVFALGSTVVSVVAVRDLASNVLMRDGMLELQLGQTEQARTTLEQSLRLDFAPHQTYFYLATTQALLGDLPAAFESAERCRTRFVDENSYILYAELAANVGKLQEAKEAIALLLATRPSPDLQIRARYIRAVVTLREGNAQDATTELETLVRDAPDFEGARITLGNVLLARGLRDDAETVYTEALALVERKLADAERELAAATTMTASVYGELRSSITTLRSERDSINERLRTIRGS